MNADRTNGAGPVGEPAARRAPIDASVVTAEDLADSLARLEAGEALADVVARHPGARGDLAGLLDAADAMRRLPPDGAPEAFRAALAAELAALEAERGVGRASAAFEDAHAVGWASAAFEQVHAVGHQSRPVVVPFAGPRGAAAMRRALVAAAMVAMAVVSAGLVWAASTGRLGSAPRAATPEAARAVEARGAGEWAFATPALPIRRAGAASSVGQGAGEARDDTGERDAARRARTRSGLKPEAIDPRWPWGAIDDSLAVVAPWDLGYATPVDGAVPPMIEPAELGSSPPPVVEPAPIGPPGGEPEPTAATPAPPLPIVEPTRAATAPPTAAATAMASPTPAGPTQEPTEDPTPAPTSYPWPTLAPGSASLAGALRIDDGAGGRPLTGATVRLHVVDAAFPPAGCDASLAPPAASTTTTDLEGRFAFDGLGAGRYIVSALDACVDGAFWNGLGAADVVADACGALVIPLADGQAAGSANIAVPAAAAERCPALTR